MQKIYYLKNQKELTVSSINVNTTNKKILNFCLNTVIKILTLYKNSLKSIKCTNK